MKQVLAVAIFGVIILSPVLISGFRGVKCPELVKGEGVCIEDAEVMRREHYRRLIEYRDKAVREGKRSKVWSFSSCQSCHPNRAEFCNRCHSFVAVKPKCFECHLYPE
jgi:hypothetical protein